MNSFSVVFASAVFGEAPITAKMLRKLLEEKMLYCSCGGTKFNIDVVTQVTLVNASYSKEFRNLAGVPKNVITTIQKISCVECGEILDPTGDNFNSPKYCFWCGKPITGLLFKSDLGRSYHHFCAGITGVKGKLMGE